MLNSNVLHALLLAVIFILIIGIAEWWARALKPEAELPRKFIHLCGGMVCLAIPYWLHSVTTVIILAVALSLLFVSGRRFGFLQSLHRIKRASCGSEFYPLAIVVIYILAQGKPWLYVCAVLVLAMADAAAALVGKGYGKYHYLVEDEYKSLEGSLVFLLIAFLTMEIPLLLLTDLSRAVCILSALLVAMVVTGLEAISLNGYDNLFIPLAVTVILSKITTKPVAEIIFQNISLILMACVLALWAWRSKAFNVGGMIVFILFCFAVWSLGYVSWAFPVLFGFIIYLLLCWALPLEHEKPHQVKVRMVTRAVFVPFGVLLLANFSTHYDVYLNAFLITCAMVLFITLNSHVQLFNRRSNILLTLAIALACWGLMIVLPSFIFFHYHLSNLFFSFMTLIILAAINYLFVNQQLTASGQYTWLSSEMLLIILSATSILLLQYHGLPAMH